MTTFDQLDTPALILDRHRLIRNCERALQRCGALGTRLRPHMKTAKAIEVAQAAVDPAFRGIAVSTLAEAKYFSDAGFTDIQYAVCLEPSKVERAYSIANRTPNFSVFVDSLEVVEILSAHHEALVNPVGVWIEIDSGEHRTGLSHKSALLPVLAQRIQASQHLRLEGVATHAGQAYCASNIANVAAIAEDERLSIVRARDVLRPMAHIPVRTSVGSTPTLMHAVNGRDIDEYRAGVYMFGDLYQAGIGSLNRRDIALTVLTSVLSHSDSTGQFFVDAGALALSKDRSTSLLGTNDMGYGELLTVDGHPYHGLTICEVAQEHGFVKTPRGMALPPIGTRFRIRPNHACMTAAMYDAYHVVENGRLVAHWPRINGWGG